MLLEIGIENLFIDSEFNFWFDEYTPIMFEPRNSSRAKIYTIFGEDYIGSYNKKDASFYFSLPFDALLSLDVANNYKISFSSIRESQATGRIKYHEQDSLIFSFQPSIYGSYAEYIFSNQAIFRQPFIILPAYIYIRDIKLGIFKQVQVLNVQEIFLNSGIVKDAVRGYRNILQNEPLTVANIGVYLCSETEKKQLQQIFDLSRFHRKPIYIAGVGEVEQSEEWGQVLWGNSAWAADSSATQYRQKAYFLQYNITSFNNGKFYMEIQVAIEKDVVEWF